MVTGKFFSAQLPDERSIWLRIEIIWSLHKGGNHVKPTDLLVGTTAAIEISSCDL